jgi:hypothetical protein
LAGEEVEGSEEAPAAATGGAAFFLAAAFPVLLTSLASS